MADRPTAWKPGQSGNPNGRPPKSRALTEVLAREANKTHEFQGKKVSGKHILARYVLEGLLVGKITLITGEILQLSPADWKEILKWYYAQVDGPPPQQLQHTGADNGPIKTENIIRVITYADDSP